MFSTIDIYAKIKKINGGLMYKFEKLQNEEITLISDDSLLKVNEKQTSISTILTNKRMILFNVPSSINNYEETLRTSRGISYIEYKEPILIVDLNDIKNVEINDDFDKYILNTKDYFYLNDKDIRNAFLNIRK